MFLRDIYFAGIPTEWQIYIKLHWKFLETYMNSKIACKWLNETSFKMIMGCFDGFSSRRVLKYGLHAESTILCALQVCPSHAKVTYNNKHFVKSEGIFNILQHTSVKLFSSRKCLNDETMLFWKSFHFKKNCCSPIFLCCYFFFLLMPVFIFFWIAKMSVWT